MSSDVILSVRGLCKEYRLAHQANRPSTAAEALINRAKNPFSKPTYEIFRSLNDVSFDIKQGEVVGVIGRNGAGKSTLLKVLSRITEPTLGEIRIRGRVGSLLEVGTGFHPELTGRENIFLNGSILGMRRNEISRQFDAIVDFAEVERFLDTPVKRYSSGMYVRLAFAVAAHLNPEILIVDEVLAVGDAQFQKKCLGKMQDVSSHDGRTVLFVSHNMATIRSLCSRCILLSAGSVISDGPAETVSNEYWTSGLVRTQNNAFTEQSGIKLEHVAIEKPDGSTGSTLLDFGSPATFVLRFSAVAKTEQMIFCLTLKSEDGDRICELWGPEEGHDFRSYEGTWEYRLSTSQLSLFPGSYTLDVKLVGGGKVYLTEEPALSFEVVESPLPDGTRAYQSKLGKFRFISKVDLKLLDQIAR